MNTINMPTFTAEASLYRTSGDYNTGWSANQINGAVYPAQLVRPIGSCLCRSVGPFTGLERCSCCDIVVRNPLGPRPQPELSCYVLIREQVQIAEAMS
jgi:hypothetical protein